MDDLVNKLLAINYDDGYTPESLAWKLLMDDVDTSLASNLLAYDPDDTVGDNSNSYIFELLLTIFMEMIFDMALIADAEEQEQQNVSDYKFNPNLKKFDLNLFLPTLTQKFNYLSILLKTECYNKTTYDESELQQILNNRYCRVILRHDTNNKNYFKQHNIPEELNYHIIGNSFNEKKKYKHLTDVYAVIMINDYLYVISFDKIKTFKELF
jgi:predicted DNA binding CopG/RHH family protein